MASDPDRTPGIAERQAQARDTLRSEPLADGALSRGEQGQAVRELQQTLNALGFRDERGRPLETQSGIYGDRTAAAVSAFQRANRLDADGAADARTLDTVRQQAALPAEQRNRPPAQDDAGRWPAPGNTQINRADKPGEGHGEFGTSRGGGVRTHKGLDIQGDAGDPIVAFGGGTVRMAQNRGAAGNMVTIDHDNGLQTRYMHLQDMQVQPGQRVEAGQQIGTMGRTGNTPRQGDTHLHFEVWRDGHAVDPLPYLQGTARGPAAGAARPPQAQGALADGVLEAGERGPDVRRLQESLNQLGYTGLDGRPLEKRSGVFGPHTEHAVRAFQRDHGLEVDGAAGPRTLPRLEEAVSRAAGSGTRTESTRDDGRAAGASDAAMGSVFSAAKTGDPQALRQALQDYLKSPAGQCWQQQGQDAARAEQPQALDTTPQQTQHDPAGLAR